MVYRDQSVLNLGLTIAVEENTVHVRAAAEDIELALKRCETVPVSGRRRVSEGRGREVCPVRRGGVVHVQVVQVNCQVTVEARL